MAGVGEENHLGLSMINICSMTGGSTHMSASSRIHLSTFMSPFTFCYLLSFLVSSCHPSPPAPDLILVFKFHITLCRHSFPEEG